MATTTLSVSNGNRGKIYTLTYSVSSNSTATTVTLTSLKVGNSSWAGSPIIIRFYADSTSTQITSITDDGWAVDSTHTINSTYSWNKAESAQTKHVLVYGKQSVNGSESTIGTTDIEVSVPALAKYAVTYNANGGSGAPATQYKVHSKSLTLSVVKPTRSGFSFVRWFTAADGTGTGYNPGATYSIDAALNLYAKWSAVPSVTSLTVIRSDENGDQDDSGTYASVTATWTMSSATSESATVTGTITPQGGTSSAITLSGTTTGTGGTVTALVPNMDTDTQYVVAITAANGSNTATRSAVLTRAFFIMDFKAGGGGIGIGRAAPSDSLAVGYNAEFDGSVDIFGPTNIDSTLDTTGKITSLDEVEAHERLVVSANNDNYGAICFNSENAAYDGVRFYGNNDEYGDEIVVGAGGRFIAGSGESAYSLHNALIDAGNAPGDEQTYIVSDGRLYLFSHCNTIANRTQLMLNNSSYVDLYGKCGADHEVNIGPSANNGATGTVTSIGKIEFQDKNGTWSSSIGSEINGSAGTVRTFFGLHNVKTDGTAVSNWFCIDLKKDGTVAYSIPYYANFRSAIWAACKPTQLYNNTSGSNGTITLSTSAASYTHMRIHYRVNRDSHIEYGATDVYSPNGKRVSLLLFRSTTSGSMDFAGAIISISGTSITRVSSRVGSFTSSNTQGVANDNNVYIVRVEGWNE